MAMIVTVECPACATAFPVDPDKVPAGGARTECTVCGTDFRVDPPSWDGEDLGQQEPWEGDGGSVEEASWEANARAFEERSVEDGHDAPTGVDAALGGDEAPGVDAIVDRAPEADAPADHASGVDAIAGDALPVETEPFEVDGLAGETLEVDSAEVVFDAFSESSDADTSDADAESLAWDATGDGFSDLADLDPVIPMHGTDADAVDAVVDEASHTGDEAGVPPEESGPVTGDLITDQWADLMDGEEEGEVEISSDWGEGEADPWIIETEEDVGLAAGGLEVERLGTVEDQVRAAQDDPGLTAPAEGVDTNELSDPEFEGFGDFMSGQETVLPEDALETDGSGLQLHGDEEMDMADPGDGIPLDSAGFGSDGSDGSDGADHPEADGLPVGDAEGGSTFHFGRRDPHDKARRLARVLVSDMITYNPDRHVQARQNGTVKEDFEEEIQKSWAEYVEQVGPELAESTDYWRDALNEILGGDEPLF